MPFLIDTHIHLYDQVFDQDFEILSKQAELLGIKQFWLPNCNSETIAALYQTEQKDPKKYLPMMGLHPCYVKEGYEQELRLVKEELARRKFIMIGEIGLDFYWDLSFVEAQEKAFLEQLALARAYKLPICIHSRSSKDGSQNAILRCVELIKEHGFSDISGIFHCFSGNYDDAHAVLDLGFSLGIGGVVTFKNGGLDKFLDKIPLESIVLETDGPYLAPVPHRGKTNEPAYLDLIATKIAEVYAVSKEKVIEITYNNALKIINSNA
jgi:TatD DNase family protein